jgi:ribonuclease HII
MAYLIGTDEAGYGPNLGPLVISATVWHTPDCLRDADLYEVLADVVSAIPPSDEDCRRVAIADSKLLYKPGGGLAALERGVLTGLALLSRRVGCWRDVWPALDPDSSDYSDALPWHDGYDAAIPGSASAEEIEQLKMSVGQGLSQAGVVLHDVCCTVVFPGRFNDLVELHGNKASALSSLTLALVNRALSSLNDETVLILCDKHGGRNRYGPLLQQVFPEYLVEVYREGRAESVYRWGPASRRIEIRFVAGGERFLPSAFASMTAKYLRELAMQAWNDFWCRHVADLRPTAGYPLDARRFKTDIQDAQARLNIDDRMLWRVC